MDFISEYYLSDLDICDRMIDLFKRADKAGLTSLGVTGADQMPRPEYKDSVEFFLGDAAPLGKPQEFKYPEWHKELSGFIDSYCTDAKLYEYCGKFTMRHPPQIQYYRPGAGYHSWHIDGGHEFCDKAITFVTYLNDVPGGGTEFMHQNKIIEAVKGKIALFPTGYTHIHRGQISADFEKYILTGWVWWDNR
jgi:hypothetical protein